MNRYRPDWSRRKFITAVSTVGGTFLLNPFSSLANDYNTDDSVDKIVAKVIGIDTHNHIDVPFSLAEFNNQKYDLNNEIKKSGLSAICMTFCVDRPQLNEKGEAYNRFVLSLDEMDALLQRNNMKRALNLSDLKSAHQQKQPTAIQAVEGGHFIEDKLERIEMAYHRGLRHLGLLHDNQPAVPLGDIYTDPPRYGGLTETGKNVIKECNRLGIVVDLTHCTNKAINDGIKVSDKPIIVSHTGLNTQLGKDEKMAKMMMPRLIAKEQAKLIAGAGGLIGIWTHLAASPGEYAQNIRAMVDVVGVEHVCVGTDTKMASAGTDNFGKNTNQSWENATEGFLYTVVKALLDKGFNESEIIKITGNNYCRLFDTATRGAYKKHSS